MGVFDHVHQVEARAEHGYGESAHHGPAARVVDDLGQGIGNVASHGEELVIGYAFLGEEAEDSEGAAQLDVGARGHDAQDGGQEVRPFLGEVVNSDLADGVAGEEKKG